jgi:hypothetical protein
VSMFSFGMLSGVTFTVILLLAVTYDCRKAKQKLWSKILTTVFAVLLWVMLGFPMLWLSWHLDSPPQVNHLSVPDKWYRM